MKFRNMMFFLSSLMLVSCLSFLRDSDEEEEEQEEEEEEQEEQEEESERSEGERQGDCTDGIDNDGDGDIDCADSGCYDKPVCDSEPCDITIDSTYPVSGSTTFYVQDSLEFELSDEDPTARVALKDSSGIDVDGTTSVAGDTVTFEPTAALLPNSSYTAELNYCGSVGPVSLAFTTSELGEALTADLVGRTYAVDLGSGNFVQPAGVGELIGGLLESYILIGIKSVDANAVGIRAALSVEGGTNQDYCSESLEQFPDAEFSTSPHFEIPEADLSVSLAGVDATLEGFGLAGTFAADASYFGGGELSAQLDARDLVGVLAEAGLDAETAEDVCNLLLGFGVQCEQCSSDAEPFCITLEVNRLVANETGETLGLVCEEDCHEFCDSNQCLLPQSAGLDSCE